MLKKSLKFFAGLPDNKVFMLFFFSSCFVLLYLRTFFGIWIDDTPYHLMSRIHVLQGKVPLMQIWDGHTGFFLTAPFFALFKMFVPDLTGLALYDRLLSLTLAIIISLFNIYMLDVRKYHDRNILTSLIPFIFLVPIMSMGYNSMTSLLIITAATLIYTESSYFFAGIVTGVMCLSYPTCAFIAIFLFAYITFRHGIKNGLFFSVGVIIIGSAFFAWIFSKGSLSEFKTAINYVINSPHTANRGAVNLQFLFKATVVPVTLFVALNIRNFIVYFAHMYMIRNLSNDLMYRKLFLISFGLFALLPVKNAYTFSNFILLLPFVFSLDKETRKTHHIFYYLILLFAVIYIFTSDMRSIIAGFGAASPVIAFVICLTLYEFSRKDAGLKTAASILSIILVIAGLIQTYSNISEGINSWDFQTFHHRALWRNSQIKTGIFKYIITSEEKKNYLEQLQEFVRANVHDNDKLCVVTLESSVYGFTNAEIYTPWAFDVQYYWAGFRSSSPLLDYFEFYNEYPDVLVATNRVNRDFYDNNPEYEINTFIKEHYVLSAQKTIENITAYIWRLKK